MKVAVVSMRPSIGNKEKNIKKMEKYINKNKADMYVFPELALTGYPIKDEIQNIAETINGSSIKYMKNLAKNHKCYIVFGMPLKDENIEGLNHNSAVMLHPNGKVDFYDKWFLPTFGPFEEKIFWDEGEKLKICKTKFGKIGLIICYDIFFPELCRGYSMLGADIIICLSATPSVNRKYFETLIPARAVENTVFFVYCNNVGTQDNLVFWGGSQIYNPLGELLVKTPYFKETIATCDIDLNDVKLARNIRPVHRDIRPQIYEDLYHISRFHKEPTSKK